MEQSNSASILYVDDDASSLETFKSLFRNEAKIYTAGSVQEAKKVLDDRSIGILITDQRMSDGKGTDLLEHAEKRYPDQIRVLITGYSDLEAVIMAIKKGRVFDYLEKP